MAMKKATIILFFFYMVATLIPMTYGVIDQSPTGVASWFQDLGNKKEIVTNLHFFFHDIVSGNDQTAVEVARASMTATSPTGFPSLTVFDDPLTSGPEPTSAEVGRAQGIYGSADMKELSLLLTMNFVFTSGEYNGSTLSVLARNPVSHTYREMPIVGGTGVFRLARGIATAHTISITATTAIVEYNVVVLHY